MPLASGHHFYGHFKERVDFNAPSGEMIPQVITTFDEVAEASPLRAALTV
jgi:hypothetical protein